MLIKTQNISKTYGGKLVLNQLNLELQPGQLIAYIGTNGAGKSTTIKILTNLLKPSSGSFWRNPDLKIGMVFQESVLDDELTVLDNLKSRAALYQLKDIVWLENLIQRMNLNPILHQEYGTLSGGQRRRVDIARALINKPNILFLDEPTTGLDIQTRQSIWELLQQLKNEHNLTIFLTTHYLEEAENADMTYILDHGNLIAKGSAYELKEKYAHHQLTITTQNQGIFDNIPHTVIDKNTLSFTMTVPRALDILSRYKNSIDDFDFKSGDMNDVFLTTTGYHYSKEE